MDTVLRVGGQKTTSSTPVPVVEIPNPEWVKWQQTAHDDTATAPPEWVTLTVDPDAVDGTAMLRFMRQSRDNDLGAVYELLEAAFGPAQMRILEASRFSVAELAEIAGAAVARLSVPS